MSTPPLLIAGAGHGGCALVMDLRKGGYGGDIVLLSDEAGFPYERPPLSKAWLTSDDDAAAPPLLTQGGMATYRVDYRPQTALVSIQAAARAATLSTGETVTYENLVLATGSKPRHLPLPGVDADRVHTLRTAGDAQALREALGTAQHLLVIGAGYIGLEVAASARGLGVRTTIVEIADRPMRRTASPEISTFYRDYHSDRGVDFVFGQSVTQILEAEGTVTGVSLSDNTEIACDTVLVAAGGVAETAIAKASGLDVEAGIVVDADARTSADHVFAIGDCTLRPSPFLALPGRIESVHNAQEQAARVAAQILGRDAPRLDAPWFWSDQYDLKLQIAGIVSTREDGGEDRLIRRESESSFAVLHYDGDRLTAVEAVNAPRPYMAARRALTLGKTIDRTMAIDPEANIAKAIV